MTRRKATLGKTNYGNPETDSLMASIENTRQELSERAYKQIGLKVDTIVWVSPEVTDFDEPVRARIDGLFDDDTTGDWTAVVRTQTTPSLLYDISCRYLHKTRSKTK